MSYEKNIRGSLLKIINTYSSRDYYKHENIPPQKLETAIQNYPVALDETPLALIDTTILGSARAGMVIGLKGIYWRNDWTTRSDRSFISWDELAGGDFSIYKTRHGVQLARDCEFGMSGSSFKNDACLNLLNNIIDLYRELQQSGDMQADAGAAQEANELVGQDANLNLPPPENYALYAQVVPEVIAFCIAADGDVEDSEVETASAIIEHDDFIENKAEALEILSSTIDTLISAREKSQAVFKLKLTTLGSKVANIKAAVQKEKVAVILDGMLDTTDIKGQSDTAQVVSYIKEKIS